MKKIVREREDIVFFIKLFPLRIHPNAYEKALAVVCEKSMKLLEDAYENKPLPKPSCETDAVDANIRLAERMGITGTPSIVLPDGSVVSRFMEAEALIKLIDEAYAKTEQRGAVMNAPEAAVSNTPEAAVSNTPEPAVSNTPEPAVSNTPEPAVSNTPEPAVSNTPEPAVSNTPEPAVSNTPSPAAN